MYIYRNNEGVLTVPRRYVESEYYRAERIDNGVDLYAVGHRKKCGHIVKAKKDGRILLGRLYAKRYMYKVESISGLIRIREVRDNELISFILYGEIKDTENSTEKCELLAKEGFFC